MAGQLTIAVGALLALSLASYFGYFEPVATGFIAVMASERWGKQ